MMRVADITAKVGGVCGIDDKTGGRGCAVVVVVVVVDKSGDYGGEFGGV